MSETTLNAPEEQTPADGFASLGLSRTMLDAIRAKGFETPSPIQRLTIPALLNSQNDIIAQAQTGTGKTAAFGLPLLEKLTRSKTPQAIILAPTRELALQVTEELLSFNAQTKLSIAAIYGGASMSEQLRRLKRGIDIVVGTPGRILDHIRRQTLDLSQIKYLVLDEADEMLNMGFIEDIEQIMGHINTDRRVLLFSATMPERIVALSRNYMRDTQILKVEAKQITTDLTDQIYFEVRESDKFDALTRIIDVEPDFYGIVFSRTKVGVDEIVNRLLERGYAAEGLHGDVSQAQREKILRKFKRKQANILVATDVAARGIDINNLTHVINYSLPQDSESYVHRIGRTGRAGNQGTAITFISSSEFRQFGHLRREINVDIKKETLPSPQDIVATKRQKIKDDLAQIIESRNYDDYGAMADELLELYPAETALAALLRLAFKNDLEESRYPEIRSINVDRRGTARLFISIGRLDGYDPRRMVELLKRECNLTDSKINDLKVLDSYSFVSVPYNDAEFVVKRLNGIRRGGRPIAEIASDKRGGQAGHTGHAGPGHKERTERPRGRKRTDEQPQTHSQQGDAPQGGAPEDDARRTAPPAAPAREPAASAPEPPQSDRTDDWEAIAAKYPGARPYREQQEQTPRPAASRKSAAAPRKGRKGAPQKQLTVTESRSHAGFDWSFFEQEGSWGDDRHAGKKRKRK